MTVLGCRRRGKPHGFRYDAGEASRVPLRSGVTLDDGGDGQGEVLQLGNEGVAEDGDASERTETYQGDEQDVLDEDRASADGSGANGGFLRRGGKSKHGKVAIEGNGRPG
jgi:hypothetical protein